MLFLVFKFLSARLTPPLPCCRSPSAARPTLFLTVSRECARCHRWPRGAACRCVDLTCYRDLRAFSHHSSGSYDAPPVSADDVQLLSQALLSPECKLKRLVVTSTSFLQERGGGGERGGLSLYMDGVIVLSSVEVDVSALTAQEKTIVPHSSFHRARRSRGTLLGCLFVVPELQAGGSRAIV